MYESPKVKFEEISLFERIANDSCWNCNNYTFDNPLTCGTYEEHIIIIGDGCGSKQSMSAVRQALNHLCGYQLLLYSLYAALFCDKQNTMMVGFYGHS